MCSTTQHTHTHTHTHVGDELHEAGTCTLPLSTGCTQERSDEITSTYSIHSAHKQSKRIRKLASKGKRYTAPPPHCMDTQYSHSLTHSLTHTPPKRTSLNRLLPLRSHTHTHTHTTLLSPPQVKMEGECVCLFSPSWSQPQQP